MKTKDTEDIMGLLYEACLKYGERHKGEPPSIIEMHPSRKHELRSAISNMYKWDSMTGKEYVMGALIVYNSALDKDAFFCY